MFLFKSNAPRRKRKTARGNYAFRRKPSAKAFTHHLDLKVETDASRRERLRRGAGQGVRIAAALLLSFVFIALIKVVVVEAFWNNARFQLKDIAVKTEGPLSKSAIATASGLKEGDHMLMISLRAVKDRLEALPEVQSAKITRNFPGTIVLDVAQRMPVAWLECPDKSVVAKASNFGCLLDESGIVVPCDHTPTAAERKLPVVRVDKLTRIALGKKVESPSALTALTLLRLHREDAALKKLALTKVDASRAHALTADYAGGLIVTFPATNNIEQQTLRLDATLTEANRHHWKLATVNLLPEHNVPVTLASRTDTATTETGKRALAQAH